MLFSSAGIRDQIYISAHIRSIYRDRYQCENQIKQLTDRHKNTTEKYLNDFKLSRGCLGKVDRLIDRIGNIEYYTCLCRFKHPLTGYLISIHRHYERGVLPFKGSLMDQPNQIIELLEMVNSAKIEEEIELANKRAKNGR